MKIIKSISTVFIGLVVLFGSCIPMEEVPVADLVIKGGTIYTMNHNSPNVEVVVVKDGLILDVGNAEEMNKYIRQETRVIDLEGATMTPGFIESHGHLMGLGYSELNLDLSGIKNYDEMVDIVAEAVKKSEPGEWILGRGWHQSKWDSEPETVVKGFQTHDKLSAVSPDNPVYLRHASGHAGFANAKAMEIAGVNLLSYI